MYEGWLEKEGCTLPFKAGCQRKQDCFWVGVNLATLTWWGYYQILNIGVSLKVDFHCEAFFSSRASCYTTFLRDYAGGFGIATCLIDAVGGNQGHCSGIIGL